MEIPNALTTVLCNTKAGCWGPWDSPCPFCKQEITVGFSEHYHFCPNCSAIYTTMGVKKGCEHIKSKRSNVFAVREPWFRSVRESRHCIAYAFESGKQGNQFCSKCRRQVVLDGW